MTKPEPASVSQDGVCSAALNIQSPNLSRLAQYDPISSSGKPPDQLPRGAGPALQAASRCWISGWEGGSRVISHGQLRVLTLVAHAVPTHVPLPEASSTAIPRLRSNRPGCPAGSRGGALRRSSKGPTPSSSENGDCLVGRSRVGSR